MKQLLLIFAIYFGFTLQAQAHNLLLFYCDAQNHEVQPSPICARDTGGRYFYYVIEPKKGDEENERFFAQIRKELEDREIAIFDVKSLEYTAKMFTRPLYAYVSVMQPKVNVPNEPKIRALRIRPANSIYSVDNPPTCKNYLSDNVVVEAKHLNDNYVQESLTAAQAAEREYTALMKRLRNK